MWGVGGGGRLKHLGFFLKEYLQYEVIIIFIVIYHFWLDREPMSNRVNLCDITFPLFRNISHSSILLIQKRITGEVS